MVEEATDYIKSQRKKPLKQSTDMSLEMTGDRDVSDMRWISGEEKAKQKKGHDKPKEKAELLTEGNTFYSVLPSVTTSDTAPLQCETTFHLSQLPLTARTLSELGTLPGRPSGRAASASPSPRATSWFAHKP